MITKSSAVFILLGTGLWSLAMAGQQHLTADAAELQMNSAIHREQP
jgi:hypothetical protein